MATIQGKYTRDDIVPRAMEIYERDIKHLVEPEHVGKFIIIDIETGEYEIDKDESAAAFRALDKRPEGLRFGMRIGPRASGRWRRLS